MESVRPRPQVLGRVFNLSSPLFLPFSPLSSTPPPSVSLPSRSSLPLYRFKAERSKGIEVVRSVPGETGVRTCVQMGPRKDISRVDTSVKIRRVAPIIPDDKDARCRLRRDLRKMGCDGLLDLPWSIREEEIARELLYELNPAYKGTVRAQPERWTATVWQEIYGFRPTGAEEKAASKDPYVATFFSGEPDPHEGYLAEDCKDDRARAVLQFLIPIVYPEKPNRVTKMMGNTILGAFTGDRPVSWGHIFERLVDRLVRTLRETSHPTAMTNFLAHLYASHKLLTEEETGRYDAEYGMVDFDSGSETASERRQPLPPTRRDYPPEPVRGKQPEAEAGPSRRPDKGKGPAQEPAEGPFPEGSNPLEPLLQAALVVQDFVEHLKSVISSIGMVVGHTSLDGLVEAVTKATGNPAKTAALAKENRGFRMELMGLRIELLTKQADLREA